MNSVNAGKAGMTVQEWLARPMIEKSEARPIEFRQCDWCLQLHDGSTTSRYCSDECASKRELARQEFNVKRESQMRLRISFEQADYETFFDEIKLRVDVNSDGCWVWTKRLKSGYPIAKWGSRQVQVHRVVLEAKHGKPLGSQAAHHLCANPACVNPDHLQPVTHRDNTAEMMQRHTYLNRIAELEAALLAIDPNNEVLNRINVA